jgi:HNH endonuclease
MAQTMKTIISCVGSELVSTEIRRIAQQLGLELGLLFHEVQWALGEERINKLTPPYEDFRMWTRRKDGLHEFWKFANEKLHLELNADEALDIWECVDLTLNARKRHSFTFQDYLMIAIRSEQKCEFCGKRPPEATLEIDHVLPVSKGGTNSALNLRFLCQYHNRSRGNRFRWADVWRRSAY